MFTKPCPFCGSVKLEVYQPAFGGGKWHILCHSCNAFFDLLRGTSKEETVTAWNRRASATSFTLTCGCRVEPSEDNSRVILTYCNGHNNFNWIGEQGDAIEVFYPAKDERQERLPFDEPSEAEDDEEEDYPLFYETSDEEGRPFVCVDSDYAFGRDEE